MERPRRFWFIHRFSMYNARIINGRPDQGRVSDPAEVRAKATYAMPSTGETIGQGKRRKFLEKLAEVGSVKLAAKHAKVARQTLYGLRTHDPEFRKAWDEAKDLGDLALEDEAYERSVIGLSDGMLKYTLQKRLPERWGDPPKTVNQNLNVTLMSADQREEDARNLLRRLRALGPFILDGVEYHTPDPGPEDGEEPENGHA